MKAYLNKKEWFSFPVAVHEMTWEQFSDVRACEQKFFKANEPELDDEGNKIEKELTQMDRIEKAGDNLDHIIELLSHVLGGDWGMIPFSVKGDNMKEMFAEKFRYTAKNAFDTDLSLMRMYVHIVNMINDYKPKRLRRTFKLEWQGELYTIDPLEAHKAISGVDYTAGEAITLLEFQKKTLERIEEKGDLDGNMAFNLGCREVALLLRKKGEQIPIVRRERIKFVDKRAKIFGTLPLNIVLDVRFFFLSIIKKYAKTQGTNSSLRALRMKQLVTPRDAKMQRKNKNGGIRGRS